MKMSATAIAKRELAARALTLRARGMPWASIARELGYRSANAALVAATRLNARELHKDVEFARSIAVERLENLMRPLWPAAMNPGLAIAAAREAGAPAPPSQLAATEQLRKLLLDLSTVEGTAAPRPVAVSGPDLGPVQIEGRLDVTQWPNPDEEYLRTYVRVLKEAGLIGPDAEDEYDSNPRLLGSGEGDAEPATGQ